MIYSTVVLTGTLSFVVGVETVSLRLRLKKRKEEREEGRKGGGKGGREDFFYEVFKSLVISFQVLPPTRKKRFFWTSSLEF